MVVACLADQVGEIYDFVLVGTVDRSISVLDVKAPYAFWPPACHLMLPSPGTLYCVARGMQDVILCSPGRLASPFLRCIPLQEGRLAVVGRAASDTVRLSGPGLGSLRRPGRNTHLA